ncbi:MAG: hypothetical protein ACFE9I_10190 [Candidatus Hermodarchaeota archaeon]
MGKKEKKKKSQKKKKGQETEADVEEIPEYSLDSALHSAKKTETTLQTLLKGVSEGQGFVHPKREGDVKITPQLTPESRSKIAEAYILEDVPLAEQTRDTKKARTPIIPDTKKKNVDSTVEEKVIKPVSVDTSSIEEIPSKVETTPIPSTKVDLSPIKKENIYAKLTEFFEGLLTSYSENYDRREMSISNILAILRKMRKITKKNTEDLVLSINNIFEKIQDNLEQFKIKRDEIEKVAEVDIESMSGEFKRVLGLLELQIKEYQLKRLTDDLIHEVKHYT